MTLTYPGPLTLRPGDRLTREDRAIDWFRLGEGAYERVEPDERGVIESATFPGLRLQVAKMLAGDLAGVPAELEPRR